MPQPAEFPAQLLVQSYGLRPRRRTICYLANAGGFSGADFWRFESERRGTFGVRRWPLGTRPERVAEVHSVLFQAADAGIDFLAVPLIDQSGNSFSEIQNRVVEVNPWLAGSADFHLTPNATRLRNAMVALAKFHQAVASQTHDLTNQVATNHVAPGIVARRDRIRDLISGRLQQIQRHVAQHPGHELSALAESILQIVKPRMPSLQIALNESACLAVPIQICLRDVRHDHILFVGDAVTGILDYDAIRADCAALDVARLAQGLIGNDTRQWQAAIADYESVRPMATSEHRLLPTLRIANPVLSAITWLEWVFVERREFEDPNQVIRRIAELAAQLD
jgi:Ser/Thr protein kinase RdoA (MazF antagonist)